MKIFEEIFEKIYEDGFLFVVPKSIKITDGASGGWVGVIQRWEESDGQEKLPLGPLDIKQDRFSKGGKIILQQPVPGKINIKIVDGGSNYHDRTPFRIDVGGGKALTGNFTSDMFEEERCFTDCTFIFEDKGRHLFRKCLSANQPEVVKSSSAISEDSEGGSDAAASRQDEIILSKKVKPDSPILSEGRKVTPCEKKKANTWEEKLQAWERGCDLPILPTFSKNGFMWRTSKLTNDPASDNYNEVFEAFDFRKLRHDDLMRGKEEEKWFAKVAAAQKIQNAKVVDFSNFSGTTRLIVPIPKEFSLKNKDEFLKSKRIFQHNHKYYWNYRTLKEFYANADEEEIKLLWQKVARVARKMLKTHRVIWINTHGEGINWLHVRIDTTTKYYPRPEQAGKAHPELRAADKVVRFGGVEVHDVEKANTGRRAAGWGAPGASSQEKEDTARARTFRRGGISSQLSTDSAERRVRKAHAAQERGKKAAALVANQRGAGFIKDRWLRLKKGLRESCKTVDCWKKISIKPFLPRNAQNLVASQVDPSDDDSLYNWYWNNDAHAHCFGWNGVDFLKNVIFVHKHEMPMRKIAPRCVKTLKRQKGRITKGARKTRRALSSAMMLKQKKSMYFFHYQTKTYGDEACALRTKTNKAAWNTVVADFRKFYDRGCTYLKSILLLEKVSFPGTSGKWCKHPALSDEEKGFCKKLHNKLSIKEGEDVDAEEAWKKAVCNLTEEEAEKLSSCFAKQKMRLKKGYKHIYKEAWEYAISSLELPKIVIGNMVDDWISFDLTYIRFGNIRRPFKSFSFRENVFGLCQKTKTSSHKTRTECRRHEPVPFPALGYKPSAGAGRDKRTASWQGTSEHYKNDFNVEETRINRDLFSHVTWEGKIPLWSNRDEWKKANINNYNKFARIGDEIFIPQCKTDQLLNFLHIREKFYKKEKLESFRKEIIFKIL